MFDEFVFQGIFTDKRFKVIVNELLSSENFTTNVKCIYGRFFALPVDAVYYFLGEKRRDLHVMILLFLLLVIAVVRTYQNLKNSNIRRIILGICFRNCGGHTRYTIEDSLTKKRNFYYLIEVEIVITLHYVDGFAEHLRRHLHRSAFITMVPIVHVIAALELEVGVVAVLCVRGRDCHDSL